MQTEVCRFPLVHEETDVFEWTELTKKIKRTKRTCPSMPLQMSEYYLGRVSVWLVGQLSYLVHVNVGVLPG